MAGETDDSSLSKNDLMRLSAGIVTAYVGRNPVGAGALEGLLAQVFHSLANLGQAPAAVAGPALRQRPAVPVGRSVQHEFIVCLEDGKRLKMLKRYLRSRYDMSPEDYRRKWGLPPEYPMVAPAYAERRSDFAKKIGLGRGVRRRS